MKQFVLKCIGKFMGMWVGQGPRETGAGRGVLPQNGAEPHLVPGAGGDFEHFKEDPSKPGVP